MSNNNRIAVILVNWNGWRDTIECLDALLAINTPGMHVFVVDNSSTDLSVERIVTWLKQPTRDADWRRFSGVQSISECVQGQPIATEVIDSSGAIVLTDQSALVTIVRSGSNLGFAAGNNVGLRLALTRNFRWFWLLNTDTVVRHDALKHLLLRSETVPHCGIIGSTLIYYREPDRVQAMGGGRLIMHSTSVSHIGEGISVSQIPESGDVVEREMAYVVGASMFVSRDFIENVGLMQEDYFLYFEEIDWALRGKPKFSLGYAPRSRIFHKVGASSSKIISEFSLNLLYRNRLRFVSRFLPERLPAAKRSLAYEFVRHCLKGRWRPAKLLAKTLLDSRKLAASAPPIKEKAKI